MSWYIHSIRSIYSDGCWAQYDGRAWARAVAEPYTAGRLWAAWAVLTGKAYAFEWPKAGDLEDALKLPFWDRGARGLASMASAERQESAVNVAAGNQLKPTVL